MTRNENIAPLSLLRAKPKQPESARGGNHGCLHREGNGLVVFLTYYRITYPCFQACCPFAIHAHSVAKSGYSRRHGCPCTRPYGTTRLSLDGFSLILVFV